VSIFLHLGSIFFLLAAIIALSLHHFFLFLFADVLHRLESPLVHPSLIGDVLKYFGDMIIKLFIDCFLILGGDILIYFSHKPIQEPHDHFIVIAIFTVGEYHIAFLEQVILKGLSVVYRFHFFVDCLVYIT
jgi:hypothetical protein